MDDKVRHGYERKIKNARDNAQNCKKAICGGIFLVAIYVFSFYVLNTHLTIYKIPAVGIGIVTIIAFAVATYVYNKKAAELEAELKRLEGKTEYAISD